ncbi:unnamed protein product [Acanthoscelides obtectus]|uniref:Uncharacterized protein n=1 Tax=Acanthoscelides obtectus TaxID=200917 RepID=A0A9P0P821_ACAOB|nr:unnamed protein product [Acanthoscelides obtectus]CAK1651890.1 hypothetical protein AOBTE_LOCUS17525 [Acanthoscelides obtectus]
MTWKKIYAPFASLILIIKSNHIC